RPHAQVVRRDLGDEQHAGERDGETQALAEQQRGAFAARAPQHHHADAHQRQQSREQRQIQVQAAQQLGDGRGRVAIHVHGATVSCGNSHASNICLAIGAATLLPPPPFSTTTASTSCGSSAGANATNSAWSRSVAAISSALYSCSAASVKTCAVPVLPAMR